MSLKFVVQSFTPNWFPSALHLDWGTCRLQLILAVNYLRRRCPGSASPPTAGSSVGWELGGEETLRAHTATCSLLCPPGCGRWEPEGPRPGAVLSGPGRERPNSQRGDLQSPSSQASEEESGLEQEAVAPGLGLGSVEHARLR